MGKTFIIAEAGVNHNGSIDMAKELIDAAVYAGADAVKFQTFHADKLVNKLTEKAEYQSKNTNSIESQYMMLKRLELNDLHFIELLRYCKYKNIKFLSTPFDPESLDFLSKQLNIQKIKIPSGEITNAPLLLKAAYTGKEIILSTGMSSLGEIEQALGVLAFGYLDNDTEPCIENFQRAYHSHEGQTLLQSKVTLLHCTTEYPAPYDEVNLRVMDTLRQAFNLKVGYSDHTEGIAVPIAAVARGAVIIEKHFTLDRKLPGPDHKASLEPEEFKKMVESIRQVEQALGTSVKYPTPSEQKNINVVRKSIVASRKIKKGEKFTEDNITSKRPGDGISPVYYWNLLEKESTRDYEADEKVDIWKCR